MINAINTGFLIVEFVENSMAPDAGLGVAHKLLISTVFKALTKWQCMLICMLMI